MKKYNYNFTIITSGGCNAKCSFCTDPMNYPRSPDYMANLYSLLFRDTLPSMFNQCSISGGEPTISPDFISILETVRASGRFEKVVLTTNGTRLLEHVDTVGRCANHVNVSRHGIGYEHNVKVFGNKQIINDEDLKMACSKLSTFGVDVNLNYVYTDDMGLTVQDVRDYIAYAKSVNAAKVTFRHDQNTNTLRATALESMFDDYAVVEDGGCPVCRSKTVMVDGMFVTFKSSFAEPGNAVGELYELIYHPSGLLTTDWAGLKVYKKPATITVNTRVIPLREYRYESRGSGGCGSGGCG